MTQAWIPHDRTSEHLHTDARTENDIWKQNDSNPSLVGQYHIDPTLLIKWQNTWDSIYAPDQAQVVIPMGYIVSLLHRDLVTAALSGATTFGTLNDFPPYSEPMHGRDLNYLTIANSGNVHVGSPYTYALSGSTLQLHNPVGCILQHGYQHIIGRMRGMPPVPYRNGILEVPYFTNDAIAANVNKVVCLSPGPGETTLLPGDYLRLGGGDLAGKFVRNTDGRCDSGASGQSIKSIGQIVSMETYDTDYNGIRGWLDKPGFDPWWLLEPKSWFVSSELADHWPERAWEGYRWPVFDTHRGVPGLTDGGSYTTAVSETFVPTSGTDQVYTFTTVNSFAPGNSVTSPVDGGGTNLLTDMSISTQNGGLTLLTYTCSGTTDAICTVAVTGFREGLPVQLDRSGAIGLAQIRLMFD